MFIEEKMRLSVRNFPNKFFLFQSDWKTGMNHKNITEVTKITYVSKGHIYLNGLSTKSYNFWQWAMESIFF